MQGPIGLATKWLRILSLGDIDKIRIHLVANPTEATVRGSPTILEMSENWDFVPYRS